MKCPKCHKALMPESLFCMYCGTQVNQKNSSPKTKSESSNIEILVGQDLNIGDDLVGRDKISTTNNIFINQKDPTPIDTEQAELQSNPFDLKWAVESYAHKHPLANSENILAKVDLAKWPNTNIGLLTWAPKPKNISELKVHKFKASYEVNILLYSQTEEKYWLNCTATLPDSASDLLIKASDLEKGFSAVKFDEDTAEEQIIPGTLTNSQCMSCSGLGHVGAELTCSSCNGTGKHNSVLPCIVCGGKGKVRLSCGACLGNGLFKKFKLFGRTIVTEPKSLIILDYHDDFEAIKGESFWSEQTLWSSPIVKTPFTQAPFVKNIKSLLLQTIQSELNNAAEDISTRVRSKVLRNAPPSTSPNQHLKELLKNDAYRSRIERENVVAESVTSLGFQIRVEIRRSYKIGFSRTVEFDTGFWQWKKHNTETLAGTINYATHVTSIKEAKALRPS